MSLGSFFGGRSHWHSRSWFGCGGLLHHSVHGVNSWGGRGWGGALKDVSMGTHLCQSPQSSGMGKMKKVPDLDHGG